jgi:hypothetical protein
MTKSRIAIGNHMSFPSAVAGKVGHLKSNIEALSIDLRHENMQEIESTVPFDFVYLYFSCLQGRIAMFPIRTRWQLSCL